MGLISGMEPWDQSNPGEDFRFSSSRSTIYVFGLVFVVLFIAWHFARAWLTLPGVYLISGGAEDAKPPGKNLHGEFGESISVSHIIAWMRRHDTDIPRDSALGGFSQGGLQVNWMPVVPD